MTLSAKPVAEHQSLKLFALGVVRSTSTALSMLPQPTVHGVEIFAADAGNPNTHVVNAYRRLSLIALH
jgi:hypothetical protein